MTTNAQNKKRKASESPIITTVKASDYKTIYANWVNPVVTPYDIALIVGDGVPSGENTFELTQTARIVFSPPEAKAVSLMLLAAVRQYERNMGPIRVPQGSVPAEVMEDLKMSIQEMKNKKEEPGKGTEGR